MPDPLAGTLAERLANLERRLDELSRRSTGHGAPIASVELATDQATIDFDDLPQRFTHVRVLCGVGTTSDVSLGIGCQLNGATRGYDRQYTEAGGNGSGAFFAGRVTDTTNIEVGAVGPNTWPIATSSVATIAHYTAHAHTWVTAYAAYAGGAGTPRAWQATGFYWGEHAPITRITLILPEGVQFTAGSAVSVYGLR